MKYKDPNHLYKPSNNIVEILPPTKKHNYQHSPNTIICYVYDREYFCKSSSVPSLIQKPTHLKDMLPNEIVPIFNRLFDSTFSKSQQLHLCINGKHVLFSTSLFLDSNGKIYGIIMHECMYSQVELLIIQTPKLHFYQNILFDETGMIYGMERNSWDWMIRNLEISRKWFSQNIIHKNILKVLPAFATECFRQLFDNLHKYEATIQFMVYSEYKEHALTFLNSVGCFQNNVKMLLLTQEIVEEVEIESINPENMNKYNMNKTLKRCMVCQRVNLTLPIEYKETYKRNIIIYEDTISPLYDNQLNIPVFGKRASIGHQHKNIFEQKDDQDEFIQVWDRPSKYNIFKEDIQGFDLDFCPICRDEWRFLFSSFDRQLRRTFSYVNSKVSLTS